MALLPSTFLNPAILLSGPVCEDLYADFRAKLSVAPAEGVVVLELSTLGGDPEIARMIGEDIRFHSAVEPKRRFVFLGKAAVYSAGVTLMSFFARENRYLTRGTRLLVHERQMEKSLCVVGPLTASLAGVQSLLHELEHSIRIQEEGFANLVAGSSVGFEEVCDRARSNWYVEAAEAVRLGLVEAVI